MTTLKILISMAKVHGWPCGFMLCLDVGRRRGSRVEGGRVIKLPCLDVFLRNEGEGFGRLWRGLNYF